MEIVIEELYNLIETAMVTFFVMSYFKTNNKFPDKTAKIAAFALEPVDTKAKM